MAVAVSSTACSKIATSISRDNLSSICACGSCVAAVRGGGGDSANTVCSFWLTATRTLTNVYEKAGRSGALIFYEVLMEVRDDDDELVVTEKTTRILR